MQLLREYIAALLFWIYFRLIYVPVYISSEIIREVNAVAYIPDNKRNKRWWALKGKWTFFFYNHLIFFKSWKSSLTMLLESAQRAVVDNERMFFCYPPGKQLSLLLSLFHSISISLTPSSFISQSYDFTTAHHAVVSS